jgi:hypothetical protein
MFPCDLISHFDFFGLDYNNAHMFHFISGLLNDPAILELKADRKKLKHLRNQVERKHKTTREFQFMKETGTKNEEEILQRMKYHCNAIEDKLLMSEQKILMSIQKIESQLKQILENQNPQNLFQQHLFEVSMFLYLMRSFCFISPFLLSFLP